MTEVATVSGHEELGVAGIEGTLTALLEAAVRRDPEAIAVVERQRHQQRQVGYGELDEISSCVARLFAGRLFAGRQQVGIWLNKSVEAIAAIYAVLRSGGAYVPIDPTGPPRRAAAVLEDCAASWLITTPERAESLRECAPELMERVSVLCVGEQWEEVVARNAGLPLVYVPTAPSDVAYILYTSGSTGTPKGVVLTHENARAFVDWAVEEFELTADDVLSSHAPLHFDLSILDVFGAVACGGSVALVPDSWVGLGAGLVRFVVEQGISVWYSVPSALRRMVEAVGGSELYESRLRLIAFAGEEYPVRHLRALREVVPAGSALYNLYGPTETNVCTFHRVEAADLGEDAPSVPPIGLPCPYATAVVVDGELCIGGSSVMQGYWNDPAKTDASLVRTEGGVFYRTGDVVRELEDGRLVYVSRKDTMVKVKGHRIELGEIEAVLERRGDVAEAVCVVAQEGGVGGGSGSGGEGGAIRLVAFVTVRSVGAGEEPDERTLRRHCREYLPTYMVPEKIEIVASLMYTSTGKIDRRSLAMAALA
ncbi:D-alanine--poly(phosphoribitol) ligase [Catenulispora yoronensis]|uniref:D-alanine--poly(Phosphoribitol) ligase n=1 Tax=Catenulispora yoronensis TaxID=450799 RepID=A0ABN2V156_9ACTN